MLSYEIRKLIRITEKEGGLRFSLLMLVSSLVLSGCVNYSGMKNSSTPLDAHTLTKSHFYKKPQKKQKIVTANWWQTFHDPQLNRLMRIALSDSPDMKQAINRIQKASYLIDASATNLWPSINFNGYVQRERFSQFGLVPPPFNGKTFNIGNLALNFSYEFDFWGKNRQLLAARISEACAAEADAAQTRLIISTAVASAYFQIQSNIQERKIAEAIYKQRKEIADIIADRAKHGIESDIPVKYAITDMENARLAIDRFREAEELARHQLSVLLGKNPINTYVVNEPFKFHRYHITLPEYLPANLIAVRPDIIASRLRAEAAAHEINVAKARFFPNINLNGLFSYQSVGLGHLFDRVSQANGVTAAVDLPIFDAGLRRANLGIRYAEYDLAVNNYNQTILVALRDVSNQLSALNSLNSQLKAQNDALKTTRQNYQLNYTRYQSGVVDYLQVLDLQNAVLQLQAQLTDLEAKHILATVAMIKALGGNHLMMRASYGH